MGDDMLKDEEPILEAAGDDNEDDTFRAMANGRKQSKWTLTIPNVRDRQTKRRC